MRNVLNFNLELLRDFDKIYCLVSGGFDSTYFYELLMRKYPKKTTPVNCFNPYEWNKTVETIKNENKKFIKILPGRYKDIIKKAFLKLPKAYKLKERGMYHKKVFPCCEVLKHKEFRKDKRFIEENVVIISGIKRGDGKQRGIWLTQLFNENVFFHRHENGILYCYPFRDYFKRELPEDIKDELRKKYPSIEHSGCVLCPVLVLFNLVSEGDRYTRSVEYARNLGVFPYKDMKSFLN